MKIEGLEERLKRLYGVGTAAEVAQLIGTRPQTLDHWLKGRRKFPIDKVVEIARSTKCSLDWLLLDKGEPGGLLDLIDDGERESVRGIADAYGRDVKRVINDLVKEALRARWVLLVSRYDKLEEDELAELDAIQHAMQERAQASSETKQNSIRR